MDSEDRSGHRACVRHLVCSLRRMLIDNESTRVTRGPVLLDSRKISGKQRISADE